MSGVSLLDCTDSFQRTQMWHVCLGVNCSEAATDPSAGHTDNVMVAGATAQCKASLLSFEVFPGFDLCSAVLVNEFIGQCCSLREKHYIWHLGFSIFQQTCAEICALSCQTMTDTAK